MSEPLTGEYKQKRCPDRSPDLKLWRPFERKEHYAESFNIIGVACLEKKGLSLSKSLQGKVATASQFTSSPIHVLLCSLSSFSTPQSVSNKLFSLFLSLLRLLSCLFFQCSEHLCCLLVWAISAWLLLCVLSCLCVYVCVCFSQVPERPGGDMLSVKMVFHSAHLSLPRRCRSFPVENPHPQALGEYGRGLGVPPEKHAKLSPHCLFLYFVYKLKWLKLILLYCLYCFVFYYYCFIILFLSVPANQIVLCARECDAFSASRTTMREKWLEIQIYRQLWIC